MFHGPGEIENPLRHVVGWWCRSYHLRLVRQAETAARNVGGIIAGLCEGVWGRALEMLFGESGHSGGMGSFKHSFALRLLGQKLARISTQNVTRIREGTNNV